MTSIEYNDVEIILKIVFFVRILIIYIFLNMVLNDTNLIKLKIIRIFFLKVPLHSTQNCTLRHPYPISVTINYKWKKYYFYL